MRSARAWLSHIVFLAAFAMVAASSPSLAQKLPPGGTTSWEIHQPEEIVTFLLFDPKASGVQLPAGLRFVSARDAGIAPIDAYVEENPDRAGWAFSFIEITRDKAFLLDGKGPTLPEDGGIALWFAPVDPSQLATQIPKDAFDRIIAPSLGAVLGLGIWIPDREYVAYMRARGHQADYGLVTLTQDSTGTYRGEIQLDSLHVRSVVTPRGDVQEDPESGTQVLFSPGHEVVDAVVVAGYGARHRECDAEWLKAGTHPVASGAFVGPTYLTTYDATLKGSLYHLRETVRE